MLCHQCGSPAAETDETCPNCGAKLKKTTRLEVKKGRGFKRFTTELKAISPEDKRAFPLGEEIAGRFVLGEMIGRGPFGQVYEAKDTEIDATVAIKVMREELVASPIDHERFLGVAKDARALNHKGLVRIHDSGVHRDAPWVSMQQLEGLSLRKVVKLRASKGETFSLEEAERLVTQLAESLEILGKKHAHGNLKPDNVVFMPELIKTTDHFVVASFSGSQRAKALAADPFASPELKKASGKLTSRSDVYSVGALLSQMLFGAPVPADGDVTEGLERYASLCDRARSVKPEDRFEDVGALSAAFVALEAGAATPPAPPTAPRGLKSPPTPPAAPAEVAESADESDAVADEAATPSKSSRSRKRKGRSKNKGKNKGKSTPPVVPVKPDPEPYTPTEDETETVEVSRAAQEQGADLQDLLTTDEVGRDKIKVAAVPELKKERTQTTLAPKPKPPEPEDKNNTPLIIGLVLLALVVVGVLISMNGPKSKEVVKLGDGVVASSAKKGDVGAKSSRSGETNTGSVAVESTEPTGNTNGATVDVVAVNTAQGEASRDVEAGRVKGEVASTAKASELASNTTADPSANPASTTEDPVGTSVGPDSSKPPTIDTPKVDTPKDPNKTETPKKDPPKVDTPKEVATTNAATGCPAGMVLVKSKKSGNTCVDRYEYPGKGKPKTNVSWFDAKKTCESSGKRLCGLSEWRRACGSKYPYGKKWDANRCNTQDEDEFERSIGGVGTFKRCRSRSGAYDMVGNVHEWVLEKKIAGGGFDSGEDVASCRYSSSKGASSKAGYVGFRCCADPR